MNPALPLDALARDMVGDGGTPNVFFVSLYNGTTVAILDSLDAAEHVAEFLVAHIIEDRLTGEVWCRAPDREDD